MRYIGGKTGLIPQIESLLDKHLDGTENTFTDLFGGSNAVGQYFKRRFQITSNDLMYFSYVIARATIQQNSIPRFKKLRDNGIGDPFQYLESAEINDLFSGYVTENFSPAGKAGRMYFQQSNAERIDFIRGTIEKWKSHELLTENEYFYLLDSLIEGIPYISNITGTYGAYLKYWDKRTYKPLHLIPSEVIDNRAENHTFQGDALELIKNLSGDIVYIDTPYNTRQYAPNYHVLETIARWDRPELHGVTGQRPYQDEKSTFSMKSQVKQAMSDLFSGLNYRHVIVSYSTAGILPAADLLGILRDNAVDGAVEIVKIPYKKYKSKIVNPKTDVEELLFYFKSAHYKDKRMGLEKKTTIVVSQSQSVGGYIKSPLNYIGGKYKLLPQIIPLFPTGIDTFVDLFSGGGNVGINVAANKVVFNDLNSKINELFRYFQGQAPDALVEEIQRRIHEYGLSKTNEDGFLRFREEYNRNQRPIDLYTLVAYSFNYQFRFNNQLKYNNPFGRNRSHFSKQMEDNLRKFVKRLHETDAVFTDKYFTDLDFSMLTRRSLVYADPPYLITTGSYNDGNRGFVNWTERQDRELFALLDQLDQRGIRFAMSNVTHHKGRTNDRLIEWARHYNIHKLNYNYRNSSHNTKHEGSCEVLITNY
jgi:adenine-specific DNA-methyltransferase